MLKAEVTAHRLEFLTQIIRLLLTMVPQQRERVLRDAVVEYSVDLPRAASQAAPDPERLASLLRDVPLP